MNFWIRLIKQYWQVALFRETPANTSYSILLLVIAAIVYFLLVFSQWRLVDVANQFTSMGTLSAAFSLVLSYVLYTWILLNVFKVANRFVQTLICLIICHTISHLFAFPLLFVAPLIATETLPQGLGLLMGVMYLLAVLLLTTWQFMLSAYIYKQALSVDYLKAIVASMGLLATNVLIVSLWR